MHASNKTVSLLTLLITIAAIQVGRSEEKKPPAVEPAANQAAPETASKQKEGKLLRHAVFFKFKDGTSEADVDKLVAAFDQLPKKIDSVKSYERGKNTSNAKLDDGLTHCFFLTFADEEGRAKYLPHPEHKAFVDLLLPHLDKAFVVDYWASSWARSGEWPEKITEQNLPKGLGGRSMPRVLRHGVFLKFRESATPEQIKDVEESFAKLPSECPTIKAFEWGKNNSSEGRDESFTHCYMFTFDDGKGLKEYASSAAHTALLVKILAAAEKGRVLDFWSKDK